MKSSNYGRMRTLLLVLLSVGLLAMLVGCTSGDPPTLRESEPELTGNMESLETSGNGETQPQEETNNGSAPANEEEWDEVVLTLHGDGAQGDSTHVLPREQAQVIADLFYHHPRESLGTPVDSVGSVQFQIGQDILTTSVDALETLSGRVQGELVLIHLSAHEYETVHQIVSQYAQDIP